MSTLRRLRKYFRDKPDVALSIPAILCFLQFLSSIFGVFRTGDFDNSVLRQLMSSADGFEAVVLFTIMTVLKERGK